jgi:hypothetical protein
MLISWIVFPLVLCLLSLGCGLLLERASGVRLPGVLLLPAGFAVIVVVGLFTIMSDSTAELTAPLVVVLAVVGLVLSPPWRRGPLDLGAVCCAVGVFAAYAAPVALSGQETFAAYLPQVDLGTWFGLTDHIMHHGRSLANLPDSNYRQILNAYLPGGYPLGSFVPLGVGHALTGRDTAWLFQPYLVFLATMLALSLYELSARLIPSRRLRSFAVFVASQPALLFAFSLWGGIKELAGAAVLALLVALVVSLIREGERGRKVLPVAVASAATLGLHSFAGGLWLMPALAAALALSIRLRGRAVAVAQAAAFAVATAVLSIPTLAQVGSFFPNATSSVITGGERATLFHFSWRQVFAIWPAGDFRADPSAMGITNVLIVLVAIAAVTGLVWAWRSRSWELVLYTGGVGLAAFVIAVVGSPWVDAKALAIASPAIAIAAMAGVLAIPLSRNGAVGSSYLRVIRIGAPLAAVAISGGILWSNVLAYHDVTLAPRAQLQELQTIGDRFAGQGPTLLSDFEPYAARHFLRKMDTYGTSGLRPFRIPLVGGRSFYAQPHEMRIDTEGFDARALLDFQTIVRRRNPASSYPSSAYRLAWSGRYFEVWQQVPQSGRIVAHLALGGRGQPVGKPKCGDVLGLARLAGRTGELAVSQRPRLSEATLSPAPVWTSQSRGAAVPDELRSGVVKGSIEVSAADRYGFWVSGIFDRRIQLIVDGNAISKPRKEFNFQYPKYVSMGTSELAKGSHSLELRYGDEGGLHPGIGGHAADSPGLGARTIRFGFGPLVSTRESPSWRVTYVKPSRAKSLCGKSFDWIEAIAGQA